jgi:hypothetical protein
VLPADDKENIRAIFLHHVDPVTPELAAELLGWDLDTMDAAIKWRAVRLDENSLDAPRINRAELLELATDQWQMSEIVEALGRDLKRVFSRKTGWPSAAALVRDALEKVPPAPVPDVILRRVAARRKRAPLPAPLPHTRRNRPDGVREATLSGLEVEYQKSVPHLRLSGRWLAKLGLKPGMRVYITLRTGRIVISAVDPAVATAAETVQPASVVPLSKPRGGAPRQFVAAAPAN